MVLWLITFQTKNYFIRSLTLHRQIADLSRIVCYSKKHGHNKSCCAGRASDRTIRSKYQTKHLKKNCIKISLTLICSHNSVHVFIAALKALHYSIDNVLRFNIRYTTYETVVTSGQQNNLKKI